MWWWQQGDYSRNQHSPSSASGIWAALWWVVVSGVSPSNIVKIVHRAGTYAVLHVTSLLRVVITPAALLGNAADGAHSFIMVIHCGEMRRLGTTSTASRLRSTTVVQGTDFSHVVHWDRKIEKEMQVRGNKIEFSRRIRKVTTWKLCSYQWATISNTCCNLCNFTLYY